jgi:DNA-binding response OmpR family regulator
MATVLVVDDEPDIRELVRLNLELDGHRVVLAADGPEALVAVKADPPDIVLLDVMMPGIDGWEVLSRLKSPDADDDVGGIPVLMLTARSDELDHIRGGIEGAIRYITKPFSITDLREAVIEALDSGPEAIQRKHAQHAALERLAMLEKGESFTERKSEARPHLTRLDGAGAMSVSPTKRRPRTPSPQLSKLSEKQCALLAAVASTPTVREAAEKLEVSRSNVYASLRRIARKLSVRSVPELVTLARQGAFYTD